MIKSIVVYYSRTGLTRKAAEYIAKELKADILELKPTNSYPDDYKECVAAVKSEKKEAYLPELAELRVLAAEGGEEDFTQEKLAQYDCLYLGSPIWMGTFACPMASFLKKYDLSGKKIRPFCTHGGGGKAKLPKNMLQNCPNSEVGETLEVKGDLEENPEVKEQWLRELKA